MADIASTLRAWSSTASSNQPQGSTTIGSGLDDNLRQIQAVVRQFLADQSATVTPSAGVADLTTATGRWVPVSGNSTITGFGSESAGIAYLVTLTGTPPIINNANISTPGAATIAGAVGDMFVADSQGAGVWRIRSYTRASGGPVRTRTRTVLTSAITSTYNTPPACTAINVRLVGGGGSGATSGANGGDTTFGTLTGQGGRGAGLQGGAGGIGGIASGGDINIAGGNGAGAAQTNDASVLLSGYSGGSSPFGGAGGGGPASATGTAAATNSGSGGGSDGVGAGANARPSGGAGGYVEKLFTAPAATYTYTVGAGGVVGTGGQAGAAGVIIVDEFYD